MIQYIKGDATYPEGNGHKYILHVCNNLGLWGRGFVNAISKRWDQPRKDYIEAYKKGEARPGDIILSNVESDISVLSMIAQNGIISDKNPHPILYDALSLCLWQCNAHFGNSDMSFHGPKFGAGLAGGDWKIIEQIIEDNITYPITIYTL